MNQKPVAMVLELPSLDLTRCTQCGDCVAICPTRCLESLSDGPWVARPLDCISCAACVFLCPSDALGLDEFVVERIL